jgi:hypothetical protein
MADQLTTAEERALGKRLLRANEHAFGIATALLMGFGLLLATVMLVVRAGPNPGPHLSLLRVYLPGYSVTWAGACVGFIYAFVAGYVGGRAFAAIYNRLTASR